MEDNELLVFVAILDVMVEFQRSSLENQWLLKRILHLGGVCGLNILGSWSRGYDVALTWRRSQVQFLPSPPEWMNYQLLIFNS